MRSRRQRVATALVLVTALAAGPPSATPCGARDDDGVAPPAPGTAPATVLALLAYNREQCDGIAGKVVAQWRALDGTPEAQLETIRQQVDELELSTLASARAASDLVGRFLPQVRQEAKKDVGDAVERLKGLMIELCDTVALPNGPRDRFETEIADTLDRIEREEAELSRLIMVPEADLENAFSPYVGHVLEAGVEAEGEYRDYLDSLKPPPKQPTLQDLMEAWHRGYAQAVIPTKQALGKYLRGRQDSDLALIRTSCREILGVVIPLLRDERALEAPFSKVAQPLRRAFVELQAMATDCTAGRFREVEEHYGEMQVQLARAAGVLAEFSLKP